MRRNDFNPSEEDIRSEGLFILEVGADRSRQPASSMQGQNSTAHTKWPILLIMFCTSQRKYKHSLYRFISKFVVSKISVLNYCHALAYLKNVLIHW